MKVRIAFTLRNRQPCWILYDDEHVAEALQILLAIENEEEVRRVFAANVKPVAPPKESWLLKLWRAIGG